MRRGRVVSGGVAIVIALTVGAAPALAGSGAVSQGYPASTSPPAAPAAVLGAGKTITRSPVTRGQVAAASGTLPFTGLQLGVVVVVAALLVAGGLLLRRTGNGGSRSA